MTGRVSMRARTWLAATALALTLAAPPARGQEPHRGGLWIDAGLSRGWLRLTCDSGCGATEVSGVGLRITLGGAPSANVLLGLQAKLWFRSPGQRAQSVMPVVQWYPWPASGFSVRAGTGIVWGSVTPQPVGAPAFTRRNTGVGMDFGVGYDLRVSGHYGLAVQATWHVAALGDMQIGAVTANDVIAYVAGIGVAFVYR